MPEKRWSRLATALCTGLDDLGMRMAEDGAHLAGGEIEDGAAVGIIDEAAFGALDDDGRKMPAIADQFFLGALPELRVADCHSLGGLGERRQALDHALLDHLRAHRPCARKSRAPEARRNLASRSDNRDRKRIGPSARRNRCRTGNRSSRGISRAHAGSSHSDARSNTFGTRRDARRSMSTSSRRNGP